jgi:protein-S-isoprenylcysteine O-methyltransferase Ste14
MRHVDVPPVWALGAALASWALARLAPVARLPEGMGYVFMAAGVGLAVWALWWFRSKRTPFEPGQSPRALVVEGPYRINRNPMYTGLTLVLVGWALSLGALSALLPAALYPFVITRRFVLSEEAALRAAFGAEADRFFARTRRW